MLSMYDETLYAESASRAGAKGYVMKRQPSQHSLEVVRRVLRVGLAFSEEGPTGCSKARRVGPMDARRCRRD